MGKEPRIIRVSVRIAGNLTDGWWIDPSGKVHRLEDGEMHHQFMNKNKNLFNTHPGPPDHRCTENWIKVRYLRQPPSFLEFQTDNQSTSTLNKIKKFVSEFKDPLENIYIYPPGYDYFVVRPEKLNLAESFKELREWHS